MDATPLLLNRDGESYIGGVHLEKLVRTYGTPIFAYDADVARRQLGRLRKVLPDCVDIYYSIKANPNPSVVRLFIQMGAGIEVASAAEYLIARKAGASTSSIVFAGPGKTFDELDYVTRAGIDEIHVEGLAELDVLEELHVLQKVAVRFNPSSAATGGAMRMGGKASQFGFDEERLPEIIGRIRASQGLQFTGLHMFAGTQILDADVLVGQWHHAVGVASKIAQTFNIPIGTVDLGGGLGIPYFHNEHELDVDRVGELAESVFRDAQENPLLRNTSFILEPGRFLAGPAGVYLARVVDVKESRGKKFVILDGGMNHHLAASGNLGQVIKRDYPIVNISRAPDEEVEEAVVVGPLCTPLDTLGRKVLMPKTNAGDIVAILQSGAYGLTASPVGFLSHRMPAEVLIDRGNVELIRSRGTFEAPMGTVT